MIRENKNKTGLVCQSCLIFFFIVTDSSFYFIFKISLYFCIFLEYTAKQGVRDVCHKRLRGSRQELHASSEGGHLSEPRFLGRVVQEPERISACNE